MLRYTNFTSIYAGDFDVALRLEVSITCAIEEVPLYRPNQSSPKNVDVSISTKLIMLVFKVFSSRYIINSDSF